MPRKTKAFKSKRREAAKAAAQGKPNEANQIWQQITADRARLKAEKAAKRAAKKKGEKV
ncbi:MAG TPA: hypothetical protein PKY77_18090 [Phycisphaerae bacterium]|nr:hypothetical protein [Phycisphaerae bacterium]HRY70236.1 hypothetical protein [Phycisphaerae bacterium]HSA27593.1 hypothetical protein [Phycisphaerae bacterium]